MYVLLNVFDKKLEKLDDLFVIKSTLIATYKSIISYYYNANCED